MNDNELRTHLHNTSVPEPIGGASAARERAMGNLRHRFPPEQAYRSHRSVWRPLGATALAGAMALAVFLVWPEPRAEADPLPSETQMQQLYDQHETSHVAHFGEVSQL